MAVFKDNNDREWQIKLDALIIRDIRKELDINPTGADGFGTLYDDDALTCEVLAVCCRKQIQAAGLTVQQFFDAVNGDAITNGFNAYLAAVTDFIPSHKREKLSASVAAMKKLDEELTRQQIEKMTDPDFTNKMTAGLTGQTTPSSSVTASPAS